MRTLLRNTLLIFIYIIKSNGISSQDIAGNILIYASKEDYLLPYIQETLTNLKSVLDNRPLFTRVTNLNLLLTNSESDLLLRKSLDLNLPQKKFEANDDSLIAKTYGIFTSYDYFLLINENTLLDKIEFQFFVYSIIKKNENYNSFPLKDIVAPVSSNNFFININDPTYLLDLKSGIKKLFPISNHKPEFKYSIKGNVSSRNVLNFKTSINDTLNLIFSSIFDYDNDVENLDFGIRLGASKVSDRGIYVKKIDATKYEINFNKTGTYSFQLYCHDKVSETITDTITIKVVEPLRADVAKKTFEIQAIGGNFLSNYLGNTYHKIKIPIFIDRPFWSLDFNVQYQNPYEHGCTFDTLLKEKRRLSSYFTDLSNGQVIRDSSIRGYLEPVNYQYNKIHAFVDITALKRDFYVYTFKDSLSSNVEKIQVRGNNLSWISFDLMLSAGHLDIKDKKRFGLDSFFLKGKMQVDYLKADLINIHIYPFKNFDFSSGIGIIKQVNSKLTGGRILNDISGLSIPMSIGYSRLVYGLKDYHILRLSVGSNKTFSGYDSVNYKELNRYAFHFNDLSVEYLNLNVDNNWGFKVFFSYSFGKQGDLKFSGYRVGIGIVNFIRNEINNRTRIFRKGGKTIYVIPCPIYF